MAIQIGGRDFLVKQGIAAIVESMGFMPVTNESLDTSDHSELVIGLFDNGEDSILELVPDILKQSPVLLVGGDFHREDVNRLIGMGVKSIVTKRCSAEEIENAINSALQGHQFYCSKVLETLTQSEAVFASTVGTLTRREREVLKLVLDGNTSQEISEMLFVSLHTINSHRKNILKKFKLKSPTELFLFAAENDLANFL